MRERSEIVLKAMCGGLAIILIFQAVRIAALRNPLGQMQLPALSNNSTSPASATPASKSSHGAVSNQSAGSTNAPSSARTSAPPVIKGAFPSSPQPTPGMPNAASKEVAIPPAIVEKIDRIIQSEILGPVPRPLPMALLGIGGPYAFIRTDAGQTGLIAEGETLGGVKLLHLGTNRVLIEHQDQKKELTIFDGFGSETLLPQGKDNPK